MPTWGGILEEIGQASASSPNPYDVVRRKYLTLASEVTNRDIVLYATSWTQTKGPIPPEVISISDEDLQGFMEVFHGLSGDNLDLVLHSPGGSLEAAEALVTYARSKFKHIRAVIPSLAMSAATMIACACDEIVMGKHSFLGPIDPQLILPTPLGTRSVAAQAIIEQFDKAKEECADTTHLPAWAPMLGQYGPDLLVLSDHVSRLSETLVREWLSRWMFADTNDATEIASAVASQLAKHDDHLSHGRHLSRDVLESMGLKIVRLEDDQQLQDAYLSLFHAATHTFTATPAVKIIENHKGRAYIKQITLAVPQQAPPT